MENETAPQTELAASGGWRGPQVYAMAAICLVLGLGIGYFLRGSQSPAAPTAAQAAAAASEANPHAAMPQGNPHGGMQSPAGAPPTLDQMKHMAEKSAEPLLEKLKKDPKNPQLLNDVGKLYRATHQFREAEQYFGKALEYDPKNAAIRTDLASCLYYRGDVDGSITQLEKAIKDDPKYTGALLNLGIIKWKGKNDTAGAVASWQKLVNTTSDPELRQRAERLIEQVKQPAQTPFPS
jgi:cytochrome c-type biogenesis protein CcmH/NrfG